MKATPRDSGQPAPAASGNTTWRAAPLDVLFVLSVSLILVLMILWIATTLAGHPLFAQPPQWIQDLVSTVWQKAILGSGVAGTAAAALALRKWLYNDHPAPNYLVCIPCFTVGLMVLMLGVTFVVKPKDVTAQAPQLVQVPLRFGVELPAAMARGDAGMPLIRIAVRSPRTETATNALLPTGDPEYPYQTMGTVPSSPDLNFLAELNPILGARYDPSFTGHLYEICLKANSKRAFPAPGTPEAASMLVKLKCRLTGTCGRTTTEANYAVACEEPQAGWLGALPVAYAAEAAEAIRPGWVVPSLDSLSKMPEQTRVGFTRFDVSFQPEGPASAASRYYYSLQVNEEPIYIDGFLPDRAIFPLQSGRENQFSFALENLNFTGQFGGFEHLHLTIVFLNGDRQVYRQELEREYTALRDAAPLPPIQTEAGSFAWTGKYIVPKNENKYEILLASAVCGTPPQKECVDRAVYAKNQFDRAQPTFDGKRVVMVVRPPLRAKAAYGLALGLVDPFTQQVQFTFDAGEAAQACHWAWDYEGSGQAGSLIRKDLNRYEVATRGYQRCQ
jgi:hypothetical protein